MFLNISSDGTTDALCYFKHEICFMQYSIVNRTLSYRSLENWLGKTLLRIQQECGAASFADLSPSIVKKKMKYSEVPGDEQWKCGLLKELLLVSSNSLNIENMEQTDISMMIDHLSTG